MSYLFLFFTSAIVQANTQPDVQASFYNGYFDAVIAQSSGSKQVEDLYYLGWSLGLNALFTDQKQYHTHFQEVFDGMVTSFKNDKNLHKQFIYAEYHFINSLLAVRNEEELRALWSFRESYNSLELILKKEHDFTPALKTLGMLEMIIGAVPDSYRWILDLMGWNGTLASGSEKLSKLLGDQSYGVEATLFVSLYNTYLLQDYTAAGVLLRDLEKNKDDYQIISLAKMAYYYKSGQAEKIMETQELPRNFVFSIYLKGEALLYNGNYPEAIAEYGRFLKIYEGSDLVKDAYYKIYIAHFLSDSEVAVSEIKEKILQEGKERSEADKYAVFKIRDDYEYSKLLLKARLATDGGFYTKAMKLLKAFYKEYAEESDINKLEYHYRLARVFHHLKRYEEAINNYTWVIETQEEGSKLYFAPNSALQMGEVYLLQGQPKKAKIYLKLAQSYKGHEYKKSIDRKSKAMLSGM